MLNVKRNRRRARRPPRWETLEDRRLLAATFEIGNLLTTSAIVIEHGAVTGDDRGGIAVSGAHVLYTGDGGTGAFSAVNLTAGTNLGNTFDSLTSNLLDETVYSLGTDATTPHPGGFGSITHLLRHDNATGALTNSSIPLSTPVSVSSGNGIFAGADRVLIHDNTQVIQIDLSAGNEGTVTYLGPLGTPVHQGCENWAYWGVAEHFGGSDYITYVQDPTTIARTRVSDGTTTTVAFFPGGLSDMCSFSVSLDRERWYFHYEGFSAAFGFGNDENIGFADAALITNIQLDRVQPDPRTTALDTLGVAFDTPINPATFDFNDITLSRDGGANVVTSSVVVTQLSPTDYVITGLAPLTAADGLYSLTVDGSGIDDTLGVAIGGRAVREWTVDSTFVPLSERTPRGSLIYDGVEMRSVLGPPGDMQALTVPIDPGQTITVLVEPGASLQATVNVTDPTSVSIGSSSATAPGQEVILQTLPATLSGTHTVTVGAAAGTSGDFRVQVILNAAVEEEQHGGPTNDTLLTAQDINGGFVALSNGTPQRGAVLGQAGLGFFAVDRFAGLLRQYDPATGSLLSSVPMSVGGNPVVAAFGLAVDPTTDAVHALVSYSGVDTALVTINPLTGEGAVIADVNAAGERFTDIAFDSAGTLYGLTGDRGANSASLFSIDKTSGTLTLLTGLSNFGGGTGEGLAYNPDDGLLYRFQAGQFESIDPNNGFAVASIPTAGANPFQSQALTYAGGGRFLLSRFNELYSITTAGVIDFVTFLSEANRTHGLALVGGDEVDFYSFILSANQTLTIAVGGAGSAVQLLDSSGTALAAGVAAENVGQIISDFLAPVTDVYYAQVARSFLGKYNLVATRDAAFDRENNNDLLSPQRLDATGVVLGHVSSIGQLLGADDGGRNLLLVDPTTGMATAVASNVGGGAGFNDLALNPVTGVLYGSQSLGNHGLYAIDAVTYTETFIGDLGGNVRAMAWSPDGTTLYGFRDSTIGTIDPASAAFTAFGDPGIGIVGGIAFQPDTGTLFAVTNIRGTRGLYTIDPTTGSATFVGDPGDGDYNSLEFLPDGTLLAGIGRVSANSGSLVKLDPMTAAPTLIGITVPVGNRNLTALEVLPPTDDFYSFSVTAGDTLNLVTRTPADGTNEFVNNLDPAIELFDPTGTSVASDDDTAGDGRNAALNHSALMPGTYTVRVSAAKQTQGEYVLDATGFTGPRPPLTVVASRPADGQRVRKFGTIELDFSDHLLLTSVDAADLTVKGNPATGVSVIDGNTLAFDIAALQGTSVPYVVELGAGVLRDLQGDLNEAFSMTLTLDATPPVVIASTLSTGDVVDPGDQVVVLTFSESLDATVLDVGDVMLEETFSGAITTANSFSYDDFSRQISMQFSGLVEGNYRLTLFSRPDAVRDLVGNELNGSPSFPLPSGTGDPATDDFVIDFVVDITVAAFPVPLSPVGPLGSLTYTGSTDGVLAPVLDTDSYTLAMDAGQTLTALLRPQHPDLLGGITVLDPGGGTLGTSTATVAGGEVLLQTLPVMTDGTYQIQAGSVAGIGRFQLQVYLNAALEEETHGGPTNGTLADAQDINGGFADLGIGTAQRAAVLGQSGRGFFAVDRFTGLLRQYDRGTGAVRSSISMTVSGNPVFAAYGLAVDPTTNLVYALVSYSGVDTALVTLNPETGEGTAIADVNAAGERFTDIAFDAAGTLYGLTGDRGTSSASLFSLDKTSGTLTFLTGLSNSGGGTGEGLAYNPDDGLLYRFQANQFQAIDPNNGFAVADIPVSGANPFQSQALTYVGSGQFLLSRFNELYSITTAGVIDFVTFLNEAARIHGLALIGSDPVDFYSFTLAANQTSTLAVRGAGSSVQLFDGGGTVLALGLPAANVSQAIGNFTAPATGTYYARVTRSSLGDYNLIVTRDATFDDQKNNDLMSPQAMDDSPTALGFVSSLGQLLGADDGDRNLLLVDPDTGVATIAASNVGGGLGFNDLARNPVTGVLYGSQSLNSGGLYRIDTVTFAETFIGDLGGNVRAMAWSPDGATLYGFRDSTFGVIDPATAAFSVISDPGIGFVGGLAFQPGSGTLFAVTNIRGARGLYTVDPTTGSATFVGDAGEGDYNALEFLADGSLLAGVGRGSANPGFLVRLDPVTAAATLVGATVPAGNRNLTALEALPATNDFYSLSVNAGDSLLLDTHTPASGPGEFVNNLDPAIELYDPMGTLVAADDDSGPDGRNAVLTHAAGLTGTYRVRIFATGGSGGEYVLGVDGNTGALPEFVVTATDPLDGARVRGPVQNIIVDFNDVILATSLQASDLTVNGTPAVSVTVVDGNTARFDLPTLTEGIQHVAIAAGAVLDIQGTPLTAFASQFDQDTTAPRVVAISIQEGQVAPAGDLSYTVQFNEPMNVTNLDQTDFQLFAHGPGVAHAASSFSFNAAASTLTLNYSSLLDDAYTLTLFSGAGQFEDTVGFALDGEPTVFPFPPNQSGDGNEGGNFFVNFMLDVETVAYPSPLEPKLPLGSLIYDPTITGFISPAKDTDSFRLGVDPGQTITVVVDPNSTLRPKIELFRIETEKNKEKANLIGSGMAASAGKDAVLQTVATNKSVGNSTSDTFQVTVSGVANTTGFYRLQVILNAAVEEESHDGPANDSRPKAQDLKSSFTPLVSSAAKGATPERTAVLGQIGGATPSDPGDFYVFDLKKDQGVTVALKDLTPGEAEVALIDSQGATLAKGTTGAANLNQVLSGFVASKSGRYFARVRGGGDVKYSLLITPDADFDTENNNSLLRAQSLEPTGVALGYVSSVSQLLGADNGNTNLLLVDPETGAATILASNVGGGRGFNDLALNPLTGVLYASQSLNSGGLYRIDTLSFAEEFIGDMGGNVRAMAWSPDGTTLYGFRDSTFGIIDPTTAEFTVIGDPGIGFVGGIAFQPSTETLFAVANVRGAQGLYTLDPLTGAAAFVGDPGEDYNSLEFLADGTLLAGVGRAATNPGSLVKLDPFTAAATLIGATVPYGFSNLTALEALPATDDYYSVSVTAGDSLVLGTRTPAGGSHEFVNDLDPAIELYNPAGVLVAQNDNSGPDGRNALLTHTATLTGLYRIRVIATKPTSGEYVLSVNGATGAVTEFAVFATSPFDGARLRGPVHQITVDFNDAILLTSLQPTDLTINGASAVGMTIVDGNTVVFDLPVLGEGPQNLRIAGGAVQDVQGTPITAFASQFYHDITAPRVIASSVQEGDVLPVGGVAITIQMNEVMRVENLDSSDFQLVGTIVGGTYVADTFGYDASGTILTLNFSRLPEDSYTLTLFSGDAQFEDLVGFDLDGEPLAFPIPPNRSGDGVEGGNFRIGFELDVQTKAFPTPLIRKSPAGSLVYESAETGLIGVAGDTDSFTLDLDAGQTVTVVVEPAGPGGQVIQWNESDGGNGHFYTLTSNRVLYPTAEAQGRALGGHLVSINGAEEQAFIEANFLTGSNQRNIYWIGADDTVEEGVFQWTSGEPFGYSNWYAGEPNDFPPGEDFATVNWHFGVGHGVETFGTWNDIFNFSTFVGLLELPTALQSEVSLSHDGSVLGSAAAAPVGTAVLQTIAATDAGSYTITVGGAAGTTGPYQVRVILNAAVEHESYDGLTNDNRATAQDLNASFVDLGSATAQRGAVLGEAGRGLFAVDRSAGLLSQYDPATGAVQSSLSMTVDSNPVQVAYGLAMDPTTNVVYALVSFAGVDTALVTLDPLTGEGTAIADVNTAGERFTDIAFDSAGTLYGLTGDRGANAASLFSIDKNSGAVTLLAALSNSGGGSGESLAYNPDDGLLYRFQAARFESIDPNNSFAVSNIPTSGSNPFQSQALTYVGDGRFLLSRFNELYSITTAGAMAFVTGLSNAGRIHGLALIGSEAVDFYSFTLTTNQTSTLAVVGAGSAVQLLDSSGTVLATGVPAENVGQIISNFTAPAAGTYTVRVARFLEGDYNLIVTRDAAFDTETNNDLLSAQNIDPPGVVLGYVSAVGHLLGADDGDRNLLLVDPATGSATIVASNVGGGAGFNDLALNPVTGVLFGSQSLNSSGLYRIDTVSFAEEFVGDLGRNVRAMAWSPDGTTLYGFRDSTFGTIDPATAAFTEIGEPGIGFVGGIAFQPGTGTLFAVANIRGVRGLYTLDPVTGAATSVGDPGDGDYNSLEFLADGTLLAGVGRASANPGFLVELDPVTAAPTLIGATVPFGNRNLTALEALPPTDDYFSFAATAGELIQLQTMTPAGDSGEFVNNLDPVIELFDPIGMSVASDDNGASDGRNARLEVTAPATGTYVVRVTAANHTQGEYVLSFNQSLMALAAHGVEFGAPSASHVFSTVDMDPNDKGLSSDNIRSNSLGLVDDWHSRPNFSEPFGDGRGADSPKDSDVDDLRVVAEINDHLRGARDRARSFRGLGQDVVGGGGKELLVAGVTSRDRDLCALCDLLAELRSTNGFATRVDHLMVARTT